LRRNQPEADCAEKAIEQRTLPEIAKMINLPA
jgi:hypothetical protein